ncbi:uncharacterized protein LOC119916497 isoform X2 [Micropterus salmoides]|uniref:uncharacterized protein LOC119916497 isoform X2 n=1 Tax=Micropterus salmoides TaxID=27706 RepID=UPI0018ED9AF5|nr:uncharacterized protein LOC119916497 isoform X2 [Micropterus salmoides]XP_045925762.1 uncharacterized protein LOC123983553 isoform X2 [Micropterus dolomieu]
MQENRQIKDRGVTSAGLTPTMDLTFILSAVIFTLLAIVVATSLLNGSSPTVEFANARRYFGHRGESSDGGLDQSEGPKLNGYVPDKKKKKKAEDDWCEISGSSHDHWDVVKSVLSEEAHPHPHSEELATPVEHSSSTSMSLDWSPEASSGRGRRSFIALSDKELLKCAFSHPQTEGATESPDINDEVESNNSLKYVPGKARSHHLQTMMSKEELEEEQRIHFNTDCNCL